MSLVAASPDVAWRFGAFVLSPSRRQLLADGRAVTLGGRAFDILEALIERAGRVVPRDELTARVWPRTIVEDSSLRVQMGQLRRALGPAAADLLVTVPGRGYSFVAGVSKVSTATCSADMRPAPAAPLVGREREVQALQARVAAHRLVTVVGAAGVGKSAAMFAAAEALAPRFGGAVTHADWGAGPDPAPLGAAGRRLVVLDDCDGDIDAAAAAIAAALAASPHTVVLASSREPLRLAGEQVVRLAPLDVPPDDTDRADAALRFDAVRLFVARAQASRGGYVLTDRDAPPVAAICRRLDGVPLALEGAAAATGVLGIAGVLAQLDGPATLDRRRRTLLARHQSLRAALDWGHARLAPREQALLRRLAAFEHRFALGDVRAVAADLGLDADAGVAALGALVAKSLVVRDCSDEGASYRMFAVTRAFALSSAVLQDFTPTL